MFKIIDCATCPEEDKVLSDCKLCHECIERYHKKLKERDKDNEKNKNI